VLKGIVEQMKKGKLTIATSVITITEVIKVNRGSETDKQKIIGTFAREDDFLFVDLTMHLAE
jgi:hypothetical protein